MLCKYFCLLMVIAIACSASAITFGEDLGGGINIDSNTLTFYLLNGHYYEADFTTDARGGVIVNNSGEPLFNSSKESPEAGVKIRLPVSGDGTVECKPDLTLPLSGYKILEINLSKNKNFDITVELLEISLNEFPQLDKNPYSYTTENNEPVGTKPSSPTTEQEVSLDKPIEICFHENIEKLHWILTAPNHPNISDSNPTIFIPLCDATGNLPPCNKPKPKPLPKPPIIIEVVRAKWYGEDSLKISTWAKIILGQQEEDEKNMDLPSPVFLQDPIRPCITCPDDNGGPDDPEVVYEVTLIHIPQCLSSNQITTWKEVIDKSQNKEAQNGEK